MEETPITAGQVLYDRTGMCIENHPSIKEAMEQYVQAKVLEALDVIKTLVYNNVTVTGEHVENLIRSKTKV